MCGVEEGVGSGTVFPESTSGLQMALGGRKEERSVSFSLLDSCCVLRPQTLSWQEVTFGDWYGAGAGWRAGQPAPGSSLLQGA